MSCRYVVFMALLFGVFVPTVELCAQDFRILNVDASNYPVIEAVFHATDVDETQIKIFSKSDFEVEENDTALQIISVTGPTKTDVPLSIVLVIDNSGSMGEDRLRIVQDAAINFIKRVPLEQSEIAVLSFNDFATVACDFTRDKNKLIYGVNEITSGGGTDYNQAFLNPNVGAMEIIRNGVNEKVIVFLTDGLSSVDRNQVIAKALSDSVSIYTVTVELPSTEILRSLSEKTNSQYYEAVQDAQDVEDIYARVLFSLQKEMYGRIKWRVPYACDTNRKGTINFRGVEARYFFKVPDIQISKVELNTARLNFDMVKPGSMLSMPIEIKAVNNPVLFKSTMLRNEYFNAPKPVVDDFLIQPGNPLVLHVSYQPKELGKNTGKLNIEFNNCPDRTVYLSGGVRENVSLVFPRGGEKLIIDTDTSILWDGIKKNRNVHAYIKLHDSVDWQLLGTGNNYSLPWNTSGFISDSVRVLVEPVPEIINKYKLTREMNLSGQLKPVWMTISHTDQSVRVGNDRSLSFWFDRRTGQLFSHGTGYLTYAILKSQKNTTILFSKHEALLGGAGGASISTHYYNRKVFNALVHDDDREFYLSGSIKNSKLGYYILTSPYSGKSDTVFYSEPIRHAAITNDATRGITIDKWKKTVIWNLPERKPIREINVEGSNDNYYINPNGKTAVLINNNSDIKIIKLEDGSDVLSYTDYLWKQFSKSGDYFVLVDADSNYCFIDSYNGTELLKLSKRSKFHTAYNGYGLAYHVNDIVRFQNINSDMILGEMAVPRLTDIRFFENNTKLLLVCSNGKHQIATVPGLMPITSIKTSPSDDFFPKIDFENDEIYLARGNKTIEVWSPIYERFTADTSGYFSIVRPTLDVQEYVRLPRVYTNMVVSIPIQKLYTNNGNVNYKLDSITIEGNSKTDFEFASGKTSGIIKPGESGSVELIQHSLLQGSKNVSLVYYSKYDTLRTTLIGEAVDRPFRLIDKTFNLGKVTLGSFKDTNICILYNSGTDMLQVNSLFNSGADTAQFKLLWFKNTILPGDSLIASIRFTGLRRGKTGTIFKLSYNNSELFVRISINGEVLAPRRYMVVGHTLSAEDSSAIQANVSISDVEGRKQIYYTNTGADGYFSFTAYPERSYGLFASAGGYITTSTQLDLTSNPLGDTIYRTLYLPEAKSGAFVTLNCIFFDFGTSHLLEHSYPELNKIVEFMNDNPTLDMVVHGHTDNVGSRDYNLKLSRARATEVMDYLISKGIKAKRLSVQAWAFDKPVATNNTDQGRAQNRRVELMVK